MQMKIVAALVIVALQFVPAAASARVESPARPAFAAPQPLLDVEGLSRPAADLG